MTALTSQEVARILGISRQAVHELHKSAALSPCAMQGKGAGTRRCWRFFYDSQEVHAFHAHRARGLTGHPPGCPDDLTLAEAAQMMHMPLTTLYARLGGRIKRGILPPVHVHGKRRYMRRSDAEQLRRKEKSHGREARHAHSPWEATSGT